MATQTTIPKRAPAGDKPPLWRNVRVLGWVAQLVALVVAVVIVSILFNNVRVSSANQGIPLSFDFLGQPAGFPIAGNDFRQTEPVRSALVEGLLNTVRVAAAGIVLATVLGVLIGIGRLSGNWLVRSICRVFVEVMRNLPLLGILVFCYLVLVLNTMPRVENSWQVPSLVVANVRGVAVPWVSGPLWRFGLVLVVAGMVAWAVARWRKSVAMATGQAARDLTWSIPAFAGAVVLGALVAGNGVSWPALEERAVVGGILMQPEYFAILLALVVYTASHIAEIVRGSIQAVPRGQFEASSALALSSVDRMRYVILPQAMRIAVPPLCNQYLNLTKNSSLGAVVSYFELTKVTQTTVGNGQPAIPAFVLTLLVYLTLSLTISAVMNGVNRRLAVVER